MTEQLESYEYEFSYVIDGKVAAVSHLNEFFYNILKNPNVQVIDTTSYNGDVMIGFEYDGEHFIMPENFVMPGETQEDPTVVPEEPPL